jgi:hypothetical protein
MLDMLLVGGYIPGTDVRITFYQFIIGLPALLVVSYLLAHYRLSLRRLVRYTQPRLKLSGLRSRLTLKV